MFISKIQHTRVGDEMQCILQGTAQRAVSLTPLANDKQSCRPSCSLIARSCTYSPLNAHNPHPNSQHNLAHQTNTYQSTAPPPLTGQHHPHPASLASRQAHPLHSKPLQYLRLRLQPRPLHENIPLLLRMLPYHLPLLLQMAEVLVGSSVKPSWQCDLLAL